MPSWEELKEKGNAEFKQKSYHSAIQIYTDAIAINADQDVLYANRSLCHKALNNLRQAISDINEALNINPKNVKNLKRKYDLLIMTGSLPEAEATMQKCINIEPKEYIHRTDLSRANILLKELNEFHEAFNTENYEKAEELGKKLSDACTGCSVIKQNYMECLINNNKLNEVTLYYTKNLSDSERSDDEFIYLMCKVFYYEGNYDKAKQTLRRLLQRVNDNSKFNHLFQLVNNIEKEKETSNALFKQGKYEEAITAYSKLLEFDPKNKIFNSTIYANRALCYKNTNKLMEALDDMMKSLKLNSKYTKGYLRRAIINMSLSNFENARYDYQKVLELEPGNSEAKKGLEEAKKKEKEAKKKDYYKVLGLDKTADENAIRKAYKKLAIKWHPDKNNVSEAQKEQSNKMFKEINEAYEVLSDPKKKQMFDNGIDPNDPESGGGFHSGGGNPQDIFNMFFGGGGGFGGGFEDDGFGSGGGHPFSQFFTTSSGGRGGSKRGGAQTFTFKFG